MTNKRNFLYRKEIKLYKWAKIIFSVVHFFLLLVVFPWILKISRADFIPCWQFIFAVWLGFLFANIRSILKLKYIWERKSVRNIKGLIPVYFPNYLITLVAICFIGSYLLFIRWKLPQSVSWYILFCLGFAADSIFEIITDPASLLQKLKNLLQ